MEKIFTCYWNEIISWDGTQFLPSIQSSKTIIFLLSIISNSPIHPPKATALIS